MNLIIHSDNSANAKLGHYQHPSRFSAFHKLWPFASRWLRLTLVVASFLFAEPLRAVTPLAWGRGHYGQLGDGNFYTTGNLGAATAVPVSGLISAGAIAGGAFHSLALKSDGTVSAWGAGYSGQLGDGNFYTTGNQGVATPVQVSGLSGAAAIAGGEGHSLALKSDGTVWAWGDGEWGQLGDGNFYNNLPYGVATPVQVSSLSAVTAIACGDNHSLALKSDGTVWAWGVGDKGQLGDGTFHTMGNQGVATPAQVNGLSGVVAIAGGFSESLALKSNGTVWTWGRGSEGQLGDGNFYNTSPNGVATPVQVSGLSNVVAIAGGWLHNLALKSDGTVWAWGNGQYGQLGDGNFYPHDGVAAPVQVSGLSHVLAIACGEHSLALTSDGMVWAWGIGQHGELGDGNFYTSPPNGVATPILASTLGQPVTAIAAGRQHSLALPGVPPNTPSLNITLTPVSAQNQIGTIHGLTATVTTDSPTAGTSVSNTLVTFTVISGPNAGQNGTGTTDASGVASFSYTGLGGVGLDVIQASFLDNQQQTHVSNNVTEEWVNPGTPLAWGYGFSGQLGDGNFSSTATPVQVSSLTTVTAIAAGSSHSLALKSDGTVWDWGDGRVGELGDGNFYLTGNDGLATPVQVSGLTGAIAIAGGGFHSLALKSDGTVLAWGAGRSGELGDGNFYRTENQGVATPVHVSGLTSVKAISGGAAHSLAIKSDGTVWTWGDGSYGELGDGNFYLTGNLGVATPVQVRGITGAIAIAGGGYYSLALKSDGTVWAWGAGYLGQLGDGNFYSSPPFGVAAPVQVRGLNDVAAIAAGNGHNLALKADGTVWAWGHGASGQLGDGNFYQIGDEGVATPFQVGGLSAVVAIACGDNHSLALKADGTVWAWGFGENGQLGDGNFYTTGHRGVATPILASGLLQPVSALAAGALHSLALPAVAANTPLVITCPTDIAANNDLGQCSAFANYPAPLVSGGTGYVVVVCNPPSGSVFPVGTTTVTCTATDGSGATASCSFNVTVNDTEPPVASCAVVKAPVLLSNPPRIVGGFRLLAADNCDPDPLIYVKGSVGSFVAGPFHNGDQVEIAHGPTLIPRQTTRTAGGNIASIQLNGDALLWAVDSSGNTSTPVKCK